MSRIRKIAALQKRIGGTISAVELDHLRQRGVDLVCLPEYFFIQDGVRNQVNTANYRQAILNKLEAASRRLVGVVVGGTLIEQEGNRFYNACHVYDCGRHVGVYRKLHPTASELELGILPGSGCQIFEVRGMRLAVLICADVLFPDCFELLADLKPDLVAIPTVSPFLPDDTVESKFRRDQEIYVAGARRVGAFVLKACGVGFLLGKRLQGRSLICSPEGVINRVNPRNEAIESALITEIDLDKVQSYQQSLEQMCSK